MPFKSITTLCFLFLFFIGAGCKAPQFTIGMSQSEFMAQNKVKMVQANETTSVYAKWRQSQSQWEFFYFRDSILVQVDYGTRSPDVLIQNGSRNGQ